MSLRIGIDATSWGNRRGFGRHTRGLVRALLGVDAVHRYVLFVDSREDLASLPERAERRLVHARRPAAVAASANGHRGFRDLWVMSRALTDPSLDVVFFPTIYSYVPTLSRAKKIVGIHDVTDERHPELVLSNGLPRLLWRVKTALGRIQADAVLTLSEYSRRGIVDRLGIPPERVFVATAASDPAFCRLEDPQPTPRLCSLGLPGTGPMIVYVGGFSPHKNLDVLLSAFVAITPRFPAARLVFAGEGETEVFLSCRDEIRRRVDELGLGTRIVFTGYLADEDLAVLLNLATVLALPSMTEGFGLPAVEAAACGCPVIATTESPLPELLGDAALYVRPRDRPGLEEALGRVLGSQSLRRHMSETGLAAAARLTWDRAARDVVAALERITTR